MGPHFLGNRASFGNVIERLSICHSLRKLEASCEIFSYLAVWKQTSIMKFIPILQC